MCIKNRIKYDVECDRICALVIVENESYEGEFHKDCLIKARLDYPNIIDDNRLYNELFINDDFILGEVAMINNNKSIIYYDEKYKNKIAKIYKGIKNFYNSEELYYIH
ncbi:TPA: hypothetical protein LA460_000079 [Clostridium botulinum]|nr:hypothetical protein [Clostridium botulinum]HBJ1652684.1 hypothetical protein [Clostridium botulinum]